MTRQSPFSAAGNGVTVALAVPANASASIRFDAFLPGTQTPLKSRSVRIVNAGSSGAFVELVGEQGAQSAVRGTGMYLSAGAEDVWGTNGATYISAIGDTGATVLYATPGEGL